MKTGLNLKSKVFNTIKGILDPMKYLFQLSKFFLVQIRCLTVLGKSKYTSTVCHDEYITMKKNQCLNAGGSPGVGAILLP